MRVVFVMALCACGRIGFESEPAGPPGEVAPVPNRVFVTSSTFAGSFGGAAMADDICRTHASRAGLDGMFVSFVAPVEGRDPVERLEGSRGWVRLDGRPVYDTVEDLKAARSMYPVALDESGKPTGACVYTGTNQDGSLAPTGLCNDWTDASTGYSGVFGSSTATGWAAVRKGFITCNGQCGVYCFEIGREVAVARPAAATGRLLFATHGQWSGGSLDSADTLCMSEAERAGASGVYVALLAAFGESPASRLASVAGPWRRGDGLLLTSGELGLAPIQLSPNIGADGLAVSSGPGAPRAWVGAPGLRATGTAADTCENWVVSTGTGISGDLDESGAGPFGSMQSRTNCGSPAFLYCAEN